MKFMKKIAAVGVAAVMAAFVFGGCSSNPKEGTTVSKNVTSEQKASESAEQEISGEIKKPEKISWMVHSGLAEEDGTKQWVDEFERLTGIDLDLRIVSNNEYYQILELAFASGDIPDVFDIDADHFAIYADQNAIADVTDCMKNADFYQKVEPELLNSIELNGSYYGVPTKIPGGSVTYVRKDWLERLDMEIPKNYEEFIKMLRRFKNEIPECKVPITAAGLVSPNYLPEFLQGANMNFVKVDGKWIDGMAQPNMEQALINLQKAYEEGLLDSEVVTNKTSNCRDQLYAGTVGVFNYWNGTWATRLTEGIWQNIPDAVLEPIPVIEGSAYLRNTPSMYCISGRLGKEKIASIFKYFIEYMHDGGEGQVLFACGVEGIHLELDSDSIKMLPSLSNPEQSLTKAWTGPDAQIVPFHDPKQMVKISELENYSTKLLTEGAIPQYIPPISKTLTRIKSDLSILKEEIMAKVVMGDMTVKEGLEKYKTEAAVLGVDKVVEEMNAN